MPVSASDIKTNISASATPLLDIDANSTIVKEILETGIASNAVSIQGYPVSATAPTAGQVLKFVSGVWTPSAP